MLNVHSLGHLATIDCALRPARAAGFDARDGALTNPTAAVRALFVSS
jgi:hypothetical protein